MGSDPWGRDYLSHTELTTANKVYTDAFLKELADDGFDSVWVHLVLRETVSSELFPNPNPKQLPRLKKLIDKTAKHGIKVYCYLCEPRTLFADDQFWRDHPEVKGRAQFIESDDCRAGIYYALCSSTKPVQKFLTESCYKLFSNAPGLGGVFCITASEFPTHCYQSYPYKQNKRPLIEEMAHANLWNKLEMYKNPVSSVYQLHHLLDEAYSCPRCLERSAPEVVAEIISCINRGVKAAERDADVIAWTWGWGMLEPPPYSDLISRLPKDVILLANWEQSEGEKVNKIIGEKYAVGEYSFSYIGPSPCFLEQLRQAKKNSLRTMAKLQVSTTHEMAAVPYIPVAFQIAEKMVQMRKHQVDGFLGCWNLGGGNTPMSKIVGEMCLEHKPAPETAIHSVAERLYGERNALEITKAWKKFSEGWDNYPFSVSMTWRGPLNYAVAFSYPLDSFDNIPETTFSGFENGGLPRSKNGQLNVTSHYLDHWVEPFGAGKALTALKKLLKLWRSGVEIISGLKDVDSENKALNKEWALARHIELSVQSTVNILRFYTVWHKLDKIAQKNKPEKIHELLEILKTEMETAEEEKILIDIEPDIGFHPEGHANLFTVKDLDYKIKTVKASIKKLAFIKL